MNQFLEELSALQLEILDDDWVQGIYHSEFLEINDLPSEYESILESVDVSRVFINIIREIETWLADDTIAEEKSWAALSQKILHQRLLTVLFYYIDYGTNNVATKEYRNNALLASRVYYKLLSIPGYKAYKVYHAQLFVHSLGCLSYPRTICENDNSFFNSKDRLRDVNAVIRKLVQYVHDLRPVVKSLQLQPTDMNFEEILSNLVDITGGAIVNKLNIDKLELANVTGSMYEMIDMLLQGTDEESKAMAIRLLFKCLLPKLISASSDSKNANNLVRASYVTYSGLLLSRYGKAALVSFNVLLQHLCYTQDGLERAEVRMARVSLVVGLMSLLPRRSYRDFVNWLLKLSSTAKVAHRHLALEILAQLLNNDAEEDEMSPSEPPAQQDGVGEADKSNGNSEDITPEATAVACNLSTDDEGSQDGDAEAEAEAEGEEEEAGAASLRARAPRVCHALVLRGVQERVHDASSALRARALAVLTHALGATAGPLHATVQELNGNSSCGRLVGAAARCVSDERAVVRRAALQLLHRLLRRRRATPDRTNLQVLVNLCRDASILVRSAAIAALGDLVTSQPEPCVLDAFLAGPLHQLSDPEAKIQEQVVWFVQQTLVEPLVSRVGLELPWLFLDAVARHNMRRHLQKACTLLAKATNVINHRLIDEVSVELGVATPERALHCLVLLTSVARHVDYSNVDFVLDYYYKLAAEIENSDARLLVLTLELITEWSRWLQGEKRERLRAHLIHGLGDGTLGAEGCRIACAALASHLDPTDLHWATELMQILERRALAGGAVGEWVRAADLSLVAPEPPEPALLSLFINTINDTNSEVWGSAAGAGALVAGAGRLCVRSRAAAAAAGPALAALLFRPRAPMASRLNALLALTDICTRYTCIVEPLLGDVCACLRGGAPLPLRRAAARALTRLLLAGYLRLRAPLYYRYVALLADEDNDVREPAEYYVTTCLTPDSIYHHFVDCVLHYNGYGPHAQHDPHTESIGFDARQLMYDVMLQRLSLVQRLNVQCKLAREVLGHAADVCDEGEELSPALNAALLDTITLLCGPRMRLPRRPVNNGDPADIDDLTEIITTNIVSHKMKRTVAEVLVPGVLRLYARLRAGGGQLAAYLVRIATDLLKDYKQEIEELIENDEELVERVRQFQETIGEEPSFGNSRNLVTASTAHEPDTPRRRPARRAAPAPHPRPHHAHKRALRMY